MPRERTRRPRPASRLLAAVSFATLALLQPALAQNAQPAAAAAPSAAETKPATPAAKPATLPRARYATVTVRGVKVFYREAGPADGPVVLLLHGFPTSSHMFRDLMPLLADKYRVIAPDYPGYGQSESPPREGFAYTFDNLAGVIDDFTRELKLERFALYLQDYGAPIGYRIASAHPERITGLIVQNGNAYVEGLPDSFWGPVKKYWAEQTPENRKALESILTLDATKWQYTHGVKDVSNISPDAWVSAQAGLDRPGNKDIQLDLFLSYGSNPPLYPKWQEYFRTHQPPTLIVWGKNDPIFPPVGAEPYKRDLKNLEFHLLDTGHFALEEDVHIMAPLIHAFLDRTTTVPASKAPTPASPSAK